MEQVSYSKCNLARGGGRKDTARILQKPIKGEMVSDVRIGKSLKHFTLVEKG
jgi:hypothetical protein